jgi:hypothetical protein
VERAAGRKRIVQMAHFVEATDAQDGDKILVNLDLVTRIKRHPQFTQLLFAAGVHAGGSWLWQEAKVKETLEELLNPLKTEIRAL